ncbi:MAG: hypothetical protein PHS96_12320 [Anaerolineales bacterium]|nr:hypothetical protein [Anaerolineales bacterium]
MTEITQWEYRVQNLGSALKGPSDEEIQAVLDEWGEEGWEAFAVIQHSGTNKVRLVAKRLLSDRARRRRSLPG